MSVSFEEDDPKKCSIYECLYSKNYEGWSEKLEEHKSAVLQLSNLIEKKEENTVIFIHLEKMFLRLWK